MPKFYPRLIKANFINTLLGLITHVNSDISVDTLALVNELIDQDQDPEESSFQYVSALIDEFSRRDTKALEVLVQNAERLLNENKKLRKVGTKVIASQTAEISGIYYSLNIIENMVDNNPVVAEEVCSCSLLTMYTLFTHE